MLALIVKESSKNGSYRNPLLVPLLALLEETQWKDKIPVKSKEFFNNKYDWNFNGVALNGCNELVDTYLPGDETRQ